MQPPTTYKSTLSGCQAWPGHAASERLTTTVSPLSLTRSGKGVAVMLLGQPVASAVSLSARRGPHRDGPILWLRKASYARRHSHLSKAALSAGTLSCSIKLPSGVIIPKPALPGRRCLQIPSKTATGTQRRGESHHPDEETLCLYTSRPRASCRPRS